MTPPHSTGRRQELLAAALLQLTESSEGGLDLPAHTTLLVSHSARLVEEADAGVLMADASAIVRAHRDALERQQALAEHIQRAFTLRVTIEQAKGLLSERLGITPDAAFDVLCSQAGSRGMKIHALAQDLLDGTLAWPSTS